MRQIEVALLNCVSESNDNVYHKAKVNIISINRNILFTESQLIIAVANMKNNKSSGHDSIFAEHIKYCSVSMLSFICIMLNSFIFHGFLPKALMSVLIVPIFKKGGSVCDWNSYRPIALANCLSKL